MVESEPSDTAGVNVRRLELPGQTTSQSLNKPNRELPQDPATPPKSTAKRCSDKHWWWMLLAAERHKPPSLAGEQVDFSKWGAVILA